MRTKTTTLEELKVLPKRSFDSVEEFIVFTKTQKDIFIDALKDYIIEKR